MSFKRQHLALARRQSRRSLPSLLGIQNSTAALEGSLAAALKAERTLPRQASERPLGVQPADLKTNGYTKTCLQLFMASLFIAGRHWKE